MRIPTSKTILTLGFVLAVSGAWAQNEGGTSNIFLYGLIGVAVLLLFFIIINVADNLLVIESRRMGADVTRANFGLFPKSGELFSRKLPMYLENKPLTSLSKGYDIKLEGEAVHQLDLNVQANRFAVQPPNFLGLMPIPKLLVEEGDTVKAGDPLFYDKLMPDIKFVAPVSGEVIAITRGAKRAIAEVVILADKEIRYRGLSVPDLSTATREELVAFLQESGAWPLIRQRPFNVIPGPTDLPRDIFISTFDTAPLAPDLSYVVEGRSQAFQRGLDVLGMLTTGAVFLGLDGRGKVAPSPAFTEAKGVFKHYFRGKHPAGNVGVQIHHIAPVGPQDKVWTLGVQDVITIGNLFLKGVFDAERVVALTGAELKEPKYVRTYIGANIGDLVSGNLANDHVRIISGDVLSGQAKLPEHYLNLHDDQITVIEEGDYYEMFGWLLPLSARPSISWTFPNFLFPNNTFRANTNTHGERRAFVVTNDYEAVMPMDIYTQQLMKAIVVNDFERMEGLGIHELVEEDVALCEFACVSKQPLQEILRHGLNTMREQG